MSLSYSQDERSLQAETPFGPSVLIPISLSGHDQISQPFEYCVDFVSESDDLAAADIVGQAVTIVASVADGVERPFHGLVMDFESGPVVGQGLRKYQATLRPWLSLLGYRRNSRIFQQKSVKQILEAIFGEYPDADADLSGLSGEHPAIEFLVQYEETDLAFVSRLMEDAGIYYYFEVAADSHKLIVADAAAAYGQADQAEVKAIDGTASEGHLTRFERRLSYGSGKYAYRDYDFRKPASMLKGESSTVAELPGMPKSETFEWRGRRLESRADVDLATTRMEELETHHELVDGASNCATFAAGKTFSVAESAAAEEEGKAWVLTRVSHSVEDLAILDSGHQGSAYQNSFNAIPSTRTFRPERTTPKPRMSGPQTATVVGPSGDEIHVDEFGRIKVQFHWDREGGNDEASSCFIRVAQSIAGAKWGAIFIPRIGQEVLVSFLQGDPDQPLVVGGVYNGDNMPPYELPANKTKSGIKTRSTTKGGPDNFNEISFEDKQGEELVYIHAEKNAERMVENDDSDTVGHDQTISIGNDRTESVGNDESISVGNDRSETVGNDESVSIGNLRLHNIGKDDTLDVGEAQTVTIGKGRTLEVTDTQSTSVGQNYEVEVGEELLIDAGKKIALVAGEEISFTAGDASIKLKSDGTIEIKGGDIKVQGSGKVEVKASKDIVLKGQNVKQN